MATKSSLYCLFFTFRTSFGLNNYYVIQMICSLIYSFGSPAQVKSK